MQLRDAVPSTWSSRSSDAGRSPGGSATPSQRATSGSVDPCTSTDVTTMKNTTLKTRSACSTPSTSGNVARMIGTAPRSRPTPPSAAPPRARSSVRLLIAAGASAILSALLAAGFGWFITDVVGPFVVSWIATDQLRIALGSEDTRKKISDLALFTNAGEGLAEEIAQRAIVAANEGNAGIAPPGTDGRDRARPSCSRPSSSPKDWRA